MVRPIPWIRQAYAQVAPTLPAPTTAILVVPAAAWVVMAELYPTRSPGKGTTGVALVDEAGDQAAAAGRAEHGQDGARIKFPTCRRQTRRVPAPPWSSCGCSTEPTCTSR